MYFKVLEKKCKCQRMCGGERGTKSSRGGASKIGQEHGGTVRQICVQRLRRWKDWAGSRAPPILVMKSQENKQRMIGREKEIKIGGGSG